MIPVDRESARKGEKVSVRIPLLPQKTRPGSSRVDEIALREEILVALLVPSTADNERHPSTSDDKKDEDNDAKPRDKNDDGQNAFGDQSQADLSANQISTVDQQKHQQVEEEEDFGSSVESSGINNEQVKIPDEEEEDFSSSETTPLTTAKPTTTTTTAKAIRHNLQHIDDVVEKVSDIVKDDPEFGRRPLRLFLNPKLRSPLVLLDHEATAIKVAIPLEDEQSESGEVQVDIPILPQKTRPTSIKVDKIALKEEILTALLDNDNVETRDKNVDKEASKPFAAVETSEEDRVALGYSRQ